MRFNDSFEYLIEVNALFQNGHFMIPPFFIQPKIENALKHGIRELEKGGRIIVKFNIDENNIIVSVIDNGVGLKAAKAKNKLHNPNTNKGIKLTHKRLEQLRKLGYQAKMDIVDLSDEDKVGTRVNITLPLKKESDYL
jgi:two-component system sensor histidine kinase YesM